MASSVAWLERTVTCTPPGSGTRLGINRDEDGGLDGDPTPEDAATSCGG